MAVSPAVAAIVADLPPYTDNPVDRLRHTLAVYITSPDGDGVLMGTMNAIPGHAWTGLTLGDLRALLVTLEAHERALYDAHQRGWNERGELADVAADVKAAEYWRGIENGRMQVIDEPSKWHLTQEPDPRVS